MKPLNEAILGKYESFDLHGMIYEFFDNGKIVTTFKNSPNETIEGTYKTRKEGSRYFIDLKSEQEETTVEIMSLDDHYFSFYKDKKQYVFHRRR